MTRASVKAPKKGEVVADEKVEEGAEKLEEVSTKEEEAVAVESSARDERAEVNGVEDEVRQREGAKELV